MEENVSGCFFSEHSVVDNKYRPHITLTRDLRGLKNRKRKSILRKGA